MAGLHFRKLSFGEAKNLTKPLSLEEVKHAMWDCDGCKSPEPDGINFDFIKKKLGYFEGRFYEIFGRIPP